MDSLLPVALPTNEPQMAKAKRPGWLRAPLLRVAIVIIPLLFGIQRANVSLYVYKTFAERVQGADVITIGDVANVESYWDSGQIMSRVTVNVEDRLKGKALSQITLLERGGTFGGIGMAVVDAPRFHVGDRSVFFLRNLADDPAAPHYAVSGRELGKVDIAKDDGGHETVTWARPELSRVDVVPLSLFALRVHLALRDP